MSPHRGPKRGSQTAPEDGGLPKAQGVGEDVWTDARGGHSNMGGRSTGLRVRGGLAPRFWGSRFESLAGAGGAPLLFPRAGRKGRRPSHSSVSLCCSLKRGPIAPAAGCGPAPSVPGGTCGPCLLFLESSLASPSRCSEMSLLLGSSAPRARGCGASPQGVLLGAAVPSWSSLVSSPAQAPDGRTSCLLAPLPRCEFSGGGNPPPRLPGSGQCPEAPR